MLEGASELALFRREQDARKNSRALGRRVLGGIRPRRDARGGLENSSARRQARSRLTEKKAPRCGRSAVEVWARPVPLIGQVPPDNGEGSRLFRVLHVRVASTISQPREATKSIGPPFSASRRKQGRTAIVENSLSRRTADDGLRGLSRFGIQRGNFACTLSPSFIALVLPPDPQQHQNHYQDESSQAISDCKVHGTHLVAQNPCRAELRRYRRRNGNATSDRGAT